MPRPNFRPVRGRLRLLLSGCERRRVGRHLIRSSLPVAGVLRVLPLVQVRSVPLTAYLIPRGMCVRLRPRVRFRSPILALPAVLLMSSQMCPGHLLMVRRALERAFVR